MSESKIQLAKAIEEGAEVKENHCICFMCVHSMVFIRAVPRPQINRLTNKMEQKMEARDQAVCHRFAAPMLIGTDCEIQQCTEFVEDPKPKALKSPGGAEPPGIIQ
jgi:hypothetical protein